MSRRPLSRTTVPVSGSVARHAATHASDAHGGGATDAMLASNDRVAPGASVNASVPFAVVVVPAGSGGSAGIGGSDAAVVGAGVVSAVLDGEGRVAVALADAAGLTDPLAVPEGRAVVGAALVGAAVVGAGVVDVAAAGADERVLGAADVAGAAEPGKSRTVSVHAARRSGSARIATRRPALRGRTRRARCARDRAGTGARPWGSRSIHPPADSSP